MKRNGRQFLYCILLVAIAGISCRKDSGQIPPPVEKKYQLVTTGTLFDPVTHKYEPFCWIDEERFPLELSGSAQGFPYGIEKRGSDLYVAGGYQAQHPVSGALVLMPCYWKNGEKIDLPVEGLSFYERCGAVDLKWFNGAIYIIGDADFKPLIWKIRPGLSPEIIPITYDNTVLDVRKGSNLELFNERLYVAGSLKREEDGLPVFTAGYWEIGTDDKSKFHIIEDGLAYALCFGITVSSNGLFIVGEYGTSPNTAKPVIWTAAGHLPVSARLNASYQRLNESVIDPAGNLYVNVLDIEQYQPLVWKLPVHAGDYAPIKPEVPAGARGFCHNLSSVDNKIGYTYSYELAAGQHVAATVFNGKSVSLELSNSPFPYLHRTSIFLL